MKLKKPVDKTCEHCGKDFIAPTNGKLYCGVVCLRGAYYQRNKFRLSEIRNAKKALEVNISL